MLQLIARALLFPTAFVAARLLHRTLPDSTSLCLWSHVTGHRCPGCGLTRAAGHLSHLDARRALHANPLVFPIALAAAGVSAHATLEIARLLATPTEPLSTPGGGKVRATHEDASRIPYDDNPARNDSPIGEAPNG
jgi:hypothetical protein